jgi:hypothetical protein
MDMVERGMVFVIVGAAAFIASLQGWRHASKKSRFAFVLIMLYASYTGIGYMVDKPLPNLQEAVSAALGQQANRIDTFLKAKPNPEPTENQGDIADE